MTKTWKQTMVCPLLGLAPWLAPLATAATFTDDFEGASISSFWTASGPGTAALTNSIAHSGSQSLKLTASPTFPWAINFTHDFGSAQSGSVSVYVQGQSLCCGSGAGVQISNAAGDNFALLQQSGNINCNSCFVARVGNPGFPESDYSFSASPLAWHLVEIDAASNGVTFKFDGVAIFTSPSVTTFQVIDLTVWGGPGGTAFFDDFNVSTGCHVSVTQTFHQYDSLPNVPPQFGYIPTPNPIGYQRCLTRHAGCALAASATMLSTFSSVETPGAIDNYLVSVLPPGDGYGKGCLDGSGAPCITSAPDWCEFDPSWALLPYVNPLQSVALVDSGPIPNATPYNADDYLNQHVCQNQDRVILQLSETITNLTTGNVATGQHFVFVTGQTSDGTDWNVFDPGWASAPDTLSGHLTGFTTTTTGGTQTFREFTLSEARAYRNLGISGSITISANSPIELLVTDPLGRRLGQSSGGAAVFEIPLGSYVRDFPLADDDGDGIANGDLTGLKNAYMPSPTQGSYSIAATGTGLGTYTITVRALAPDGSVQSSTIGGIANVGTAATYNMSYSSAAGMSGPMILMATFSSSLDDVNDSLQLGLINNGGIANSLTQKLQAAAKVSGTARNNILKAFKNEVNAQSGKHIVGIAIQVLLQDADSLLTQNP